MFKFFCAPIKEDKIIISADSVKYYSLEDQVQIKDALEYHRRKEEYHAAMVKMLEVRMTRTIKISEKMNKSSESLNPKE